MDIATTPLADEPRGTLAGAPRAVRHLEPPEAPWAGCLATDADASCFLVAAGLLDEWPGWDADPDGHVLAPLDLVRRAGGHDVLLPLCTERLARFLQRRAGRGVPLSGGEAVTVVVSVLRGTAEVLTRTPFASGEWWLTDAGKPVFVHGDGPDAIMAADLCLAAVGAALPETAELRVRLGAGGEPQSADLAHPRALRAALPELEAALFARSAPEPLATTDLAPARARAVGVFPEQADDVLAHTARPRWSPLAGFVDADLREVVAAGWDAVRESRRRRARSRGDAGGDGGGGRRPWRRILIVAAVAGAVATTAGLLWPGGDGASGDGVSAHSPGPAPTASRAPERTPAPTSGAASSPPASASAPEAVSLIRAVLAARIACGRDATCRASYLEDSGRMPPAGAIDDAAHSVELLDDFGGAAVVRVTSAHIDGSGRSQLVVAVRSGRKWLIRDVTDAADQPK